jgi:hypothetical protein
MASAAIDSKSNDIVVFETLRDSACVGCGGGRWRCVLTFGALTRTMMIC